MGVLEDRVVLVSGAARGQGEAMARRFVAEGAQVVLGDIRDDEGKAVADELGEQATYVHLDVRLEEHWADAVRVAQQRYGKLDGLVNNAGILHTATLEQTTAADFMEVVEVNQLGVFLGMKVAIPALRAAGRGTIVNVSSIDGRTGMRSVGAYCASKYAVVGLTKVAAMELGGAGIRVNAMCPGVIQTPMLPDYPPPLVEYIKEKIPLHRFGTAAESAALALFLTSEESSYCTGGEFVFDGGWTAGV